ncbi:MAG: hypothetical protein M1820_003680 [Bogoriella megaspora]|nr:MAG: hypothetical protein M1820_003680 [Bogoriella megaspora]
MAATKIKQTAYGGVQVYLGLLGITICAVSIFYGYLQERWERIYPTPPEWRFFTKWAYREAAAMEDGEGRGRPPNWAQAGPQWENCLRKLEDTGTLDGRGLQPLEHSLPLENVPAWDATDKSEEWKRGYFEVAMGCGRAAEHLRGFYRDRTRPDAPPVPADAIVGPSNLDPRPLPKQLGPPPREENCEPAMDAPDQFYLRIINSKGFSRRQQLLATLALADYWSFVGDQTAAEELYRNGLEMVSSSLGDAGKVVDTQRGVILDSAGPITPNALLATTALAVHHATQGNISEALPIFLSGLRALRQHSITDKGIYAAEAESRTKSEISAKEPSLMEMASEFLKTPPYPPPRLSGDEPLESDSAKCSEARLLAYIGEILFAGAKSDKDRERALNWAKDAADLAESRSIELREQNVQRNKKAADKRRFLTEKDENGIEACSQCLEVGLTNLETMVSQMLRRQSEKEENASRGWLALLGFGTKQADATKYWQHELDVVSLRLGTFKEQQVQDLMAKEAGGIPVVFRR